MGDWTMKKIVVMHDGKECVIWSWVNKSINIHHTRLKNKS